MSDRKAELRRKTDETEVKLRLVLDGKGDRKVDTGIGFLDHMLSLLAKHGLFDLTLEARGDLEVDDHHTVEDVGIALGEAIRQALGGKERIRRFGTSIIPMDESLAMVAIDLIERASCCFDALLKGKIGTFDAELIEEFFFAVSRGGSLTLHAKLFYGRNAHHMAEALFKALGRALDEASQIDERMVGVPSTKGRVR